MDSDSLKLISYPTYFKAPSVLNYFGPFVDPSYQVRSFCGMASNVKNLDQVSASRSGNKVEDDEELQGDLRQHLQNLFNLLRSV